MQSFLTFLPAVLAVTNGFAPTVQTRVLASRPSTFLQMAGDIKISAKMVSELRQKTDSPMMECKKALIEANGDFAAAEEILRVKLGIYVFVLFIHIHSSHSLARVSPSNNQCTTLQHYREQGIEKSWSYCR